MIAGRANGGESTSAQHPNVYVFPTSGDELVLCCSIQFPNMSLLYDKETNVPKIEISVGVPHVGADVLIGGAGALALIAYQPGVGSADRSTTPVIEIPHVESVGTAVQLGWGDERHHSLCEVSLSYLQYRPAVSK